jgi:hypothetical protein
MAQFDSPGGQQQGNVIPPAPDSIDGNSEPSNLSDMGFESDVDMEDPRLSGSKRSAATPDDPGIWGRMIVRK